MGLGQNDGSLTFVNISKGKLVIKKDGEVKTFGYLEGQLVDIEVLEDEYNNEKYLKLSLKIKDGAETYLLQMRLDSGYGRAFCCIIPNANLEWPMKISPSFKDDRGGLFIKQNGFPLKWYFNKENPRDLPQLKKVKVGNRDMWDNSDQQAYFINMLMLKIKPKLKHEILAGPATPVDNDHSDMPPANVPSEADIQQPVDDLPF